MIAIFVGKGNNGGDGLTLAKKLIEEEYSCIVFSLAHESAFKNEAKLALEDFLKTGGILNTIDPFVSFSKYKDTKPEFALIVDAMLGNGASLELKPPFKEMARLLNLWGIPVLAADAPTGYDSKMHIKRAHCVMAKETLLFGFPRLDAYVREGAEAFGHVEVAPLNYSNVLAKELSKGVFLATPKIISLLKPLRNEWGDKRAQGSALILAGSKNMPGAAALCTKAALHSGAGLVTLATPDCVFQKVASTLFEPVYLPLYGNEKEGVFSAKDIPLLLKSLKHTNAFAAGPGLSTAESIEQALVDLLLQVEVPMVLDADALNILSKTPNVLLSIKVPTILTPHVREYERLFGSLPPSAVDIPESLSTCAVKFNKVIILKGAPTFIALPNGNVYVTPCANSGMAKGGSGDVLTGILVSLLSLGVKSPEVAVLGVLLHTKSGLFAKQKKGAFSMLPSDVIECLPYAFHDNSL